MTHPYESPEFAYGNWNEPHLYLCIRCEDRHQPPVGVVELLDAGGAPSADFQPLCWKHMADEVQGWVAFIEGFRTAPDAAACAVPGCLRVDLHDGFGCDEHYAEFKAWQLAHREAES